MLSRQLQVKPQTFKRHIYKQLLTKIYIEFLKLKNKKMNKLMEKKKETGKRSEQTPQQERYIDGKRACEKTCNIICH